MTPAELTDLLPSVVEATRAAAEPVMALFQRSKTVWDKGGMEGKPGDAVNNPLTEADLAADKILRDRLPALLPGSAWLSEETTDDLARLQADACWIVDPIDGTREYVEGVPHFAISVALAWKGDPVLAVLLNPAEDDLHTAVRGGGAFRNGTAVGGNDRTASAGATLLASRTETRRGEFEPFKRVFSVKEVGSTAWKLALVAAGEGDAYFTRKPRNEWDIAAGVLLCREAGLAVTDLGRARHVFNRPSPLLRGVVASAAGIHDELMDRIEAIGTLE